jgi:hypothetical protein
VNDSYIGWWGMRRGKWHFAESEVTDRILMRCGRMMPLVNAYGILSFEQEPPGERCEQCTRQRVAD